MKLVFTISWAVLGLGASLAILVIGVAPLAYFHPPLWVDILTAIVIGVCLGSWLRLTWRFIEKIWVTLAE